MDGPMAKPGSMARSSVMAIFHFENDISFLFPYINATAAGSELHENPDLVRFVMDEIHCVIYPERCIATPLEDRDHAKAFKEKVMVFLNGVLEKKGQIIPKFKVFQKAPVTEIIKLLPRTNCGKCGMKTCIAFAASLSKQQIQPSQCPYLGPPLKEQVVYPVYDKNGIRVSAVTLDIDTSGNRAAKRTAKTPVPLIEKKTLDAANTVLPFALSKREIEVLSLMAQGQTNREISENLDISPHTVKTHVVHIFNKLGVNHRTQAVVWAARHRII